MDETRTNPQTATLDPGTDARGVSEVSFIALHYVADGVLMMTRPRPLVPKLVRPGVCLCRRARR